MTSAIVRTGKLKDGDLHHIAKQIIDLLPDSEAMIEYPAGQSAKINKNTKFTKSLLNSKDQLIQTMTVSFPGTVREKVAFHRGVVDPETWKSNPYVGGYNATLPDTYFDELAFLQARSEPNYGNPRPAPPDTLERETVFAILRIVNSYAVDSTHVGQIEGAANVSDATASQIADLRSLNLDMTRGLAEARQESDRLFLARQQSLDEIQSQREQYLAERETELQNRRDELNDREPQHERRRLREHLTLRLQSSIAEPRLQTGVIERRSYYFYLIAGLIFLALSVFLSTNSQNLGTSDTVLLWARLIKAFSAGAAGAAFIWSGLAGLKSSAVATRDYEQSIQRYAFDMDRASWIVETILQMNSAEKSDVPSQWLQSVCRDLFATSYNEENESKSLQAFAALFDATARAKIGTTGIEFEVDRKGAKKLASG